MTSPLYTIGECVSFSSGYDTQNAGATPGAYIQIAGAFYMNNEWHYFSNGITIVYPESNAFIPQ